MISKNNPQDEQQLIDFLTSLIQGVKGGDPKYPLFIMHNLPRYLQRFKEITEEGIMEILDYVTVLGAFDAGWEAFEINNPHTNGSVKWEIRKYTRQRGVIKILEPIVEKFVKDHNLVNILKNPHYLQSWICPQCNNNDRNKISETSSRTIYGAIFERKLTCKLCDTVWLRPIITARCPGVNS